MLIQPKGEGSECLSDECFDNLSTNSKEAIEEHKTQAEARLLKSAVQNNSLLIEYDSDTRKSIADKFNASCQRDGVPTHVLEKSNQTNENFLLLSGRELEKKFNALDADWKTKAHQR